MDTAVHPENLRGENKWESLGSIGLGEGKCNEIINFSKTWPGSKIISL